MESVKEYFLNYRDSGLFVSDKIVSSKAAYDIVRKFYHDDIKIYESVFMLMLNNANIPIGYCKISQGGITGSVVDVKILAKYAIESLSQGVIVVHNHPSGKLEPSSSDVSITNNIKECLKVFGIVLIDHLIITETSYFSFSDEGRL